MVNYYIMASDLFGYDCIPDEKEYLDQYFLCVLAYQPFANWQKVLEQPPKSGLLLALQQDFEISSGRNCIKAELANEVLTRLEQAGHLTPAIETSSEGPPSAAGKDLTALGLRDAHQSPVGREGKG